MKAKNNIPIDFFLLIFAVLIILFVPDSYDMLPIIGVVIIIVSLYLILKVRKNNSSLILFTIIGLINISVGVNDLIFKGVYISPWQLERLRMTEYNGITAKTILLFISVINLFVRDELCSKGKCEAEIQALRKSNKYIAIGGIVALYFILFMGIAKEVLTRTAGRYVSVDNPLYEYGVIILCLTWYYSKNSKIIDKCIKLFVLLYSLSFLIIGDRSSVFMYILLTYLLYYRNKFRSGFIFVGVLFAIIVANLVDVARNTSSLSTMGIIRAALSQGLYVGTASWSYYGGIAVVALSFMAAEKSVLVVRYLLRLIGINTGLSSFTSYASENYSLLFNQGGGMCSPYLYMIGGYVGVIVGAALIGLLIKKLFTLKRADYLVYSYLIIAMSLRWYLYNPTVFFRSILLMTTLIFLFCKIVHSMTTRH